MIRYTQSTFSLFSLQLWFHLLSSNFGTSKNISEFTYFSDLSPNMSKCEIAGNVSLKGVKAAVCCMKNIDLTKDAVKIIGISFSFNKAIQNEQAAYQP